MTFENELCEGPSFPRKSQSVTTHDAATATRVVTIDLQEFTADRPIARLAQEERAAPPRDEEAAMPEMLNLTGRVVETQPLDHDDMMSAFRALREARAHRHEDDMVIDAIVDDTRSTSLTSALKGP